MNTDTIVKVVEKHSKDRGALIAILQDIQSKYGYLPPEALNIVASETGHALVDIYGIATFYRSFRLKPKGKHLVAVCLGTACHVRGGPMIAEEFQRQLQTRAGGTTSDKEFTLETANCLGACALGPIVVIDGHYFSNVDTSKVQKLITKARTGLDKVEIRGEQRIFPLEVSCPRCNHSLMNAKHLIDGYPSIHVTMSFGHQHGWLRLSGLYGSYSIESEHEAPVETVVNFFCPHCHAELAGASNCTDCDAPVVPMMVRGGGIVQICSRRGCRAHMLDLNGVNI